MTWTNEPRPTVHAPDQWTSPRSVSAATVAANRYRPRRNAPVNIPAPSPATTSVIVLPFAEGIEHLSYIERTRRKNVRQKQIDDILILLVSEFSSFRISRRSSSRVESVSLNISVTPTSRRQPGFDADISLERENVPSLSRISDVSLFYCTL